MTTKLVFEGPDTLVFWKESGIPTVPLKNTIDGTTLLSIASAYYPEIVCCHGENEWEGGVIHRLDNLTKGLVLIARSQRAYDALMQQQKKDMIQKEYLATVTEGRAIDEGFEPYPFQNPLYEDGMIISYFRSFGPGGKSVRPSYSNARYAKGRIYTTLASPESDGVIRCTITRGFRHQIRAHLAWAGCPISGDTQYGGRESDDFGLEAVSISYIEPCSGRKLTITS